ncbi:dTDP-4-dehydrorhamnose 3,5-epimerase [Candidatus Cetobacterium colombiensis]|uniref:dTDP-4-dehydrorhamnose 3,5-epimerase n=1 Tax=Candidatus Cetobacterium colombiensis TaxID=3073100 RepID=A0ABU4W8U6_9FUSO|nr:dTDP-4-dehydrorhamnose 3,5-epimerase [Candidatus Cetobacterium colombiensis]MDX8335955.1 dTDP-4-dehydrorhamnose 3,5-epimerase [Candidatus Cetobacterium colombiensis]
MIKDLVVIEPKIYSDSRGFFYEFFNRQQLLKCGIDEEFVQGNHSKSNFGVLRGLHFQIQNSQGKLIRVLKGEILDVVVDLRKNSETFGKHFKIILSEENRKMLFVPKGFAHGFLTLRDNSEIEYLCTDFYSPQYDSGILWKDKDLDIDWELEKYGLKEEELIISEKDKNQGTLKEFLEKGGEIK